MTNEKSTMNNVEVEEMEDELYGYSQLKEYEAEVDYYTGYDN